jgi:hypothetical protein
LLCYKSICEYLSNHYEVCKYWEEKQVVGTIEVRSKENLLKLVEKSKVLIFILGFTFSNSDSSFGKNKVLFCYNNKEEKYHKF